MFNNIALDVFIGLTFVFLLYSLLATILQELIARWFNLRSRMLLRAIRRMLEDQVNDGTKKWQRFTFLSYFYEFRENIRRYLNPIRENEHLVRKFYDHPSIKYLGEDRANSKPSYLQHHNFSYTLVQLLRGNFYDGSTQNEADLIKSALDNNLLNMNAETLSHVQHLFTDARQDVYLFRQRLEQWFDETMQRANGWYKKQSQLSLIFLGFFVAWTFNVDTISIYNILATNKAVRDNMVEMAIQNRGQYQSMIASLDSAAAKGTSGTMVVQQVPDSVLKQTYERVAKDAERSSEILGLGKPWKDTIRMLKQVNDDEKQKQDEIKSIYKKISVANDSIKKYTAIATQDTGSRRTFSSFISVKKALVKDLRYRQNQLELIKQKQQYLNERCDLINTEMKATSFKYSPNQQGGITTFLGWLLTALAISLGAPFWFDLLSRFVQLRASGQRVPAGRPVSGIAGSSSVSTVVTPDNKPIRG